MRIKDEYKAVKFCINCSNHSSSSKDLTFHQENIASVFLASQGEVPSIDLVDARLIYRQQ